MNNREIFLLFTLLVLIAPAHLYRIFSDDNHHLCSLVTKRKITLEPYDKSAVLIRINRVKDHSIPWLTNFLCTFEVNVSKERGGGGVFAVIQQITLRKNETTNECIDYVHYKRKNGQSSQRFCGRFNAALSMDRLFAPGVYTTNLAETSNSFVDPDGHLEVNIFISRQPLEEDEERDLSIAFTAYKNCSRSNDLYEKCSDERNVCIYKDYIQDGIVNCPYLDCVDEKGCSTPIMIHKETHLSVGDKVIIGSITTIVFMFMIFVLCIYVCRKFHACCWSEEFANPLPQTNRTIELEVTQTQPSAPNQEEDKDLPPPYETLFPDR